MFTEVSVICYQSIEHRWALGTVAETENVDYCLSFADQGKQTSVFRLQKINGSCRFPLVLFPFIYISLYLYFYCIYQYIYISSIYVFIHTSLSIFTVYICCRFKQKTEAQAIFLNPFSVCSLCKRKFVVCPFVYEETNGNYPFANGLNRTCLSMIISIS
jgi:hypothetical protein